MYKPKKLRVNRRSLAWKRAPFHKRLIAQMVAYRFVVFPIILEIIFDNMVSPVHQGGFIHLLIRLVIFRYALIYLEGRLVRSDAVKAFIKNLAVKKGINI